MDLDDQMRRYFGTDDLAMVPAEALAAGIEHMRVDLGLEQDRSHRFALWALMFTLDAAPDLDAVFKDAADRDAARDLMEMSERLTPTEEDDVEEQARQAREPGQRLQAQAPHSGPSSSG